MTTRPPKHAALALVLALAAAPGAGASQALTGDQIRSLVSGNTLSGPVGGRPYSFTYTPEGRVYGTIGADTGNGSWRIKDGDLYCHQWSVFFGGTENCYRWYPDPEKDGRYVMKSADAYRQPDLPVWRVQQGSH